MPASSIGHRRLSIETGCIDVPGLQPHWLLAVRGVLIAEIVVELIDLFILLLVNTNTKWREVKMKRPWSTMFSGVIVWGMLIWAGFNQTQRFPLETQSIILVGLAEGPCRSVLYPAGLRGAIIAWSDGVFESLGGCISDRRGSKGIWHGVRFSGVSYFGRRGS